MKLHQPGVLAAQHFVARTGGFADTDEPQTELLARLQRESAVPCEVSHLLHILQFVSGPADDSTLMALDRCGASAAAPARVERAGAAS
jgi:hypothetical protein